MANSVSSKKNDQRMAGMQDIPSDTIEERFGVIGERKGYITPAELVKALEIQALENIKDGVHRFVGEILIEQGYLTRVQLDDILRSIETAG